MHPPCFGREVCLCLNCSRYATICGPDSYKGKKSSTDFEHTASGSKKKDEGSPYIIDLQKASTVLFEPGCAEMNASMDMSILFSFGWALHEEILTGGVAALCFIQLAPL
mmetsp:Transcript_7910/g.22035  ORF Transcript_7910/g.22035 Transcript_7910/m.22035 type:complete len:109 (+) Transcript_7910:738-1064(+)